jgi:hypothetical protein
MQIKRACVTTGSTGAVIRRVVPQVALILLRGDPSSALAGAKYVLRRSVSAGTAAEPAQSLDARVLQRSHPWADQVGMVAACCFAAPA